MLREMIMYNANTQIKETSDIFNIQCVEKQKANKYLSNYVVCVKMTFENNLENDYEVITK